MVSVSQSFPAGFPYRPYCGAPPMPGSWLAHWNLDPRLIAVFLIAAAGYAVWARRASRPAGRSIAVYAGMALTLLFLVCPLCPLSVALFSARVGQHMLLAGVAAPVLSWGLAGSRWTRASLAPAAAAAFAVMMWVWHAPGPYTATFESDGVYWLMHATLFGSAVWLWSTLWSAGRATAAHVLAAGALTSLQMGCLAMLIAFDPRSLYPPHRLTDAFWGIAPQTDQAIGGGLMLAPLSFIFAAALIRALSSLLNDPPTVGAVGA